MWGDFNPVFFEPDKSEVILSGGVEARYFSDFLVSLFGGELGTENIFDSSGCSST